MSISKNGHVRDRLAPKYLGAPAASDVTTRLGVVMSAAVVQPLWVVRHGPDESWTPRARQADAQYAMLDVLRPVARRVLCAME